AGRGGGLRRWHGAAPDRVAARGRAAPGGARVRARLRPGAGHGAGRRRMTASSAHAALRGWLADPWFRLGARDMAATGLGIAAWGLVTGVAMVKSGIPAGLAIFMSLAVYAGSAQLAVLPLMTAGAPLWVVWLTAACVNLRFVIFSSMWRGYFAHLPRRRRLWLGYFSGDVIFV